MSVSTALRVSLALAACSCSVVAQRKQGSPLDQLPANLEMLTHFGERADFSPDNQRIAFMAKSFGDAFVIDLKTRIIRCLTCNVPGAAFLRVMHLSSGDYLLIGAERFTDIRTSRGPDNELWFLSRAPGSRPVRLNQKMSEGAAVSKRAQKIAFSVTSSQDPEIPKGSSKLYIADVEPTGLVNRKVVHERSGGTCTLEAQDFFDNDTRMTFTCYEPKGLASVWTMDLATGKLDNMSQAPGWYNEVEGIFPDGKFTCVEADRQVDTLGGDRGFRNIDIW
jgi:Tol biopolymer transport system component